MKDNASYDNASSSCSNLPLDDFFAALRRGGIGVTPVQMAEANQLLLQYAPLVPNEAALCQYLCPLFATNQAEQERFREIFAAHFSQKEEQTPFLPPPPPPPPRAWWKYLLVLLPILLLIGWWIWNNNKIIIKPPVIVFSVDRLNDTSESDDELNQYVKGDTLLASITVDSRDTLLAKRMQIKTVYKWGDNTPDDTIGRHVYTRSGVYKAQALVKRQDEGDVFKTDTIVNYVRICDFPNGLVISSTAKDDSIPVGKPLYFSATVASDPLPDSIVWNIHNNSQMDSLSELSLRALYVEDERLGWELKTEGTYAVSCTIIYGNADGPCTFTKFKTIYAHDPNKPQMAATLRPAANAKLLKPAYKVKAYWFWVFGGGVLLCLLLSLLFKELYRRLQRAQEPTPIKDADYEHWLASFASTKPPVDIPFLNKNALAPPEPTMAIVGRLMRRRIASEAMYMHIGKTIAKALRNSGFFKPAMEPRTQQSEYLLLIEESHINSQLTQLFNYLADTLHRHNVFVEKYYYRYEPSLCYSAAAPNGISLDRLSEKYPHHILVIAGHAHQLVYSYQPIVSPYYQNLLSRWTNKAILTPLPFADWGVAEKNILPTVIPVFPADTVGHLLMMQGMTDSRMDIEQQLKEQQGNLYSTVDIDFKAIDELAAYCQLAEWAQSKDGDAYNNLLFQWIAALAVYPKLQWELSLAIGKALFDKAGLGHQINFSNLLRLARISWMQEGMMPPELRLELLKKLQQENEVLARETILLSLKEIPTSDLKPGHAAYEEKETQRIINEFNLYAYDPVKYADYEQSSSIFERLWNDKKLMEAPVKKYLRNPHAHWPTLINTRLADGPTDAAYVPLDDYFKPLPPITKGLAKLYKALTILSNLLIGVCMLGLIGLLVLQVANTKRLPLFTQQKNQLSSISFVVRDSASRRMAKEVFVRVGDTTATFTKSGNLQLLLSDSDRVVAIAVNGKVAFDTFMPINRNAYEVIVKDKVDDVPAIRVIFNFGPDCGDIFATINRYRQLVESAATGFKVVLGPSSGQKNKAGTCVNSIQVGKNVGNDLVEKLVGVFKEEGLFLVRDAALDATTPDDEIYITSVAESGITKLDTVTVKPVIHLQVSDASMLSSAEGFRRRLISKGYQVNRPTVMDWSYKSEINYFDNIMANEAQTIQRLHRSYFPTLSLQATLSPTNDKKPNDNRIVVWMKKVQGDRNGGDPKPDERAQDTYTSAAGKRIVSIAKKEIGTGETPPGSNKTKYGEWFNPKLNEAGFGWSAVFVSWVYDQAGLPLYIAEAEKGFSSFVNLLQVTQSRKLLTDDPEPGDVFILDRLKSNYQGGIFIKWIDKAAGTFETVEGNISLGKNKNGYVGKGVHSNKTQKVYFVHFR